MNFAAIRWTDRFAFDLALGLEGSGDPIEEVLERHKLTVEDLTTFGKDPIFAKAVEKYREDIRVKGLSFKLKAKAQAEELLLTSWTLIHHPDVSAAVKADLIKSTVKWAGLEPKGDAAVGDSLGGVRITINLGGDDSGALRTLENLPEIPVQVDTSEPSGGSTP